MRTRILHTKFWEDHYVIELEPSEKLLYIYYLTNEKVNIIWCYECSDRKVMWDTGCGREQLDRFKEKLEKDRKIFFYKGYVFLINAHKYESYEGFKTDKAKEKLFREFNSDILKWYQGCIKKMDKLAGEKVDTTILDKVRIDLEKDGVIDKK